MQGNTGFRRRRFFQVAASGAAATAGCGGQKSRWRFFTNAEAAALAAICDNIIPPDGDPGASQAGVVTYIDRQLTTTFKKRQAAYRNGIAALNALAGTSFDSLAEPARVELLTAVDLGKKGTPDVRAFFNEVIAHTMQGYYGDPRHGGNRNRASWRMLGVPSIPVRGRA